MNDKLNKDNFKGHEIIKYISKTLPNMHGVSQMENEKGDILYIGKAKNLAKRVINYTSINNLHITLLLNSNELRCYYE